MKHSHKRLLSRREAVLFKKRWEAVNAAEIEELRRTPISQKMQQLASLMGLVKELGWYKILSEGEAELRNRWNRLKDAYHV